MVARVIVTGANGSGKSYFANCLAQARPDLPLQSFDAIKLTQNWQQRERRDVDMQLQSVVTEHVWILEGGPSLLPIALPHAQAVVWLDPPFATRAWRLAKRPWAHLGQTRPELPQGNPDRLGLQYRFAYHSLRKEHRFRADIHRLLSELNSQQLIYRCRNRADCKQAYSELAQRQARGTVIITP